MQVKLIYDVSTLKSFDSSHSHSITFQGISFYYFKLNLFEINSLLLYLLTQFDLTLYVFNQKFNSRSYGQEITEMWQGMILALGRKRS